MPKVMISWETMTSLERARRYGSTHRSEHGLALVGRPRQHQHVDAVRFKGAAGGGAHRIVEDHAIRRQLRLLAVVFRHGQVDVPGKISPNILQNILPQDQRLAEGRADGLLGKIVIGGAQAAGGKDDVRPLPGDLQRLPQPFRVVPYHGMPEHIDANSRQRP